MKRGIGRGLFVGVGVVVLFVAGAFGQGDPAAVKTAWVVETHNKCKVLDRQPFGVRPEKPNYQLWWSGTCKDGFASGSGYLQWGVPNKYPDFPPLVIAQYDGPLVMGTMTGNGSMKMSSSEEYKGDLVDNAANGFGTASYPDGSSFEGHFARNVKSGHGIARYADGSTIEGEWAKDEFGNGFVIWNVPKTGKHFEGYFVDGRASGHGYFIENGVRHEGEWKNGHLTDGGTKYTVARSDLFPK